MRRSRILRPRYRPQSAPDDGLTASAWERMPTTSSGRRAVAVGTEITTEAGDVITTEAGDPITTG